jgi:ATP-dependent RNA helicase RhlE
LTQFSDLGLAEGLLRALSGEGYTTPTPIQMRVIPAILAGNDVLGTAQTGTGKTAAFVLPILQQMIDQPSSFNKKGCRALILAPTRELATQIADSIRTYGRNNQTTVAVVVGGVRPGPQIKAVAPGIDFIVATPGRLLDHLSAGAIQLNGTTTVVLDEADQMLDLGFIPAIRKILAKVPEGRQTMLLSATMPKQIRRLASDFLRNPTEVAVAPESRPIEKIDQKVMFIDAASKRRALVGILNGAEVERAIVFTRTKRGADKVNQHLEKAGITASAIHGNKSQRERERSLEAFRSGRVKVMVATDIAARGIDVDNISHVVNFELPHVPESYVHRIGRTARAGKSGIAISLCDREERGQLRDIERLVGYGLATLANPFGEDARGERQERGDRPERSDRKPAPTTPRKPNRRRPAQSRKAQENRKKAGGTQGKRRNDKNVGEARAGDSNTAGLARVLGKVGVSAAGENYLRR